MNKPKFRAWDESDKKMIEWEHLINYCDIGYLFGGYDGGFGKEGPKSYEYPIPMQYTGLKDKNGVEIYEGDVCEWHIPDMGRPEPDAMIRYASVVEYRQGSFNLSGYLFPNVRLIKVLGNIYTNPELLNEVE
ncbi:YopX family protein [Enterococcus sp. AZ101]|uniref:YopX family protein n=1 Tax=Enterococcus sp. AZ101 TaxID=2774742 RepID=UPI003D26DF19